MLAEGEGMMSREGSMIPTRYTHKQLASMIEAQRETIKRTFKALREGRDLEVRRRLVRVHPRFGTGVTCPQHRSQTGVF
jgi:CRP/FNR family transcriptional regulator, cyclic AMP receptor protein